MSHGIARRVAQHLAADSPWQASPSSFKGRPLTLRLRWQKHQWRRRSRRDSPYRFHKQGLLQVKGPGMKSRFHKTVHGFYTQGKKGRDKGNSQSDRVIGEGLTRR